MNFQDDLLRNLRTKDEVETEKQAEIDMKLTEEAQSYHSRIKETLIRNVYEGNYSIVDGNKTISCVVSIYHSPEIEDTSYNIPIEPSILDRIFGRGYATQRISRFRFDIKTEYKDMIEKLQQLAAQDGIQIELCVLDDRNKRTYPLYENISGYASKSSLGYSIAVKCTSIIPDTYSTDEPINVMTEDSENANIENGLNIDAMEGHEFERFCADLLVKNGFGDVRVTKGSGDQGVDVIANKDGVQYGIQCKCYNSDIGNKAVQEAYSGKSYYRCHVGAVLTNRYFTRAAIALAKSNGILLWDRDYLLNLIKAAGLKMN